ncbi:WG repeat-containing protein [Acidovorax sp. M2(2025)]|uniref:WG repeat-containing protein n=1 Tax=Acidovorax sp. M2(2025) TaxID=3411355 RepID=UPI003BF54485
MHRDRPPASAAAAPWLASLPLDPACGEVALLIVHQGRAAAPAEGLREVHGFHADGAGGWIAPARAADGGWGYIGGDGQWRVPPALQQARGFCAGSDGLAAFCDGGRWGFIDLAGQVALAPVFEEVHPFSQGVAPVQRPGDGWCLVDRRGQPIGAGATFAALGPLGPHGLARATVAGAAGGPPTHGFVDRQGRWAIAPGLRSAQPFGAVAATAASRDGVLHGLIDLAGHWVLEPRYACLDAFNADGLAFFAEPGAGDGGGCGYVDAAGRVVVRGGRHLSRHMACGVVADRTHGTRFLTARGQPLPGAAWSFGTDFSADRGVAVVRADTPQTPPAPPWGLLHPDGRFVPAPAQLLEPLTDGAGRLVAPLAGTPLVPFITRDGQMAWVDGDGTEVWRAHYDGQQAALLDATGAVLWRSSVRDLCWPPRPFFHPPLADHLEGLQTLDGIVPLAQRLLARAATEGLEPGARCRVLHAGLSAPLRGPYAFLAADLQAAAHQAQAALAQRLAARYGAPVMPGAAGATDGSGTLAWAVPAAGPLPAAPGTPAPAGAPRIQWLTLEPRADPFDGDGAAGWELWLAATAGGDAPPPSPGNATLVRPLTLRRLGGLAALAGHGVVSAAAWHAEGAWAGAATLLLAGFSELYWAWQFLFSDPWSPGLALTALLAP